MFGDGRGFNPRSANTPPLSEKPLFTLGDDILAGTNAPAGALTWGFEFAGEGIARVLGRGAAAERVRGVVGRGLLTG